MLPSRRGIPEKFLLVINLRCWRRVLSQEVHDLNVRIWRMGVRQPGRSELFFLSLFLKQDVISFFF